MASKIVRSSISSDSSVERAAEAEYQMDKPYTLQVGERRFYTTINTLKRESGYFAALFSERLSGAGSIVLLEKNGIDADHFVDADGDTFAHILKYLRDKIYPTFFDHTRGCHDQGLKVAVLKLAKYFLVQKLVDWIKTGSYLKCVKTQETVRTVEDLSELQPSPIAMLYLTEPIEEKKVEFFPHVLKRTVYVCPRDIPVHRGSPDRCGKVCSIAQGDAPDKFEEEHYVEWTQISRTRKFEYIHAD